MTNSRANTRSSSASAWPAAVGRDGFGRTAAAAEASRTGQPATSRGNPGLSLDKQDSVGALLRIGQAVAQVPGVTPGIAMAATLTCIQDNTGLAVETLCRALPAAEDPSCSLCGLQHRNARDEWALTERGREWAEVMPYCRQNHSGYQIPGPGAAPMTPGECGGHHHRLGPPALLSVEPTRLRSLPWPTPAR